jgi:selenocysteine-specific elongation factor
VPVIGTAGHVDHGKTALIAALTGIDTDRLPEEKARGMTTDLGFAHFRVGASTIGIIDVPGHERYMRNMVAGAAGVEGALLVVAADDGWMEQTGRHVEVLAALGIPIIVIVVTKSGIVPPGRAGEVGGAARARLGALGVGEPPWVAVDSLKGEGIEELRGRIGAALDAGLHPAGGPRGAGRAFMFVDRSFTLARAGHVVAGSLWCGGLAVGDPLLLLPAGETLRIRTIQRYGSDASSAEPGSRVALTLSKPKSAIVRGDLLVSPGGDFQAGDSFYLALDPAHATLKPRAGSALELAAGTAHRDALVWPSRTQGFLRVAAKESLPLAPGLGIVLLRKGGADILASGRVLALGGASTKERRGIEAALPRAAEEARRGGDPRAALRLALAGCLPAEVFASAPSDAEIAGGYVFDRLRWETARNLVLRASEEPGGFPASGMAARLGLGRDATEALLRRLASEGQVRIAGARIVGVAGSAGTSLSRQAAELLLRLEGSVGEGLDLDTEARPGAKRDLDLLCTLGKATSLDGRLYLSVAAYRSHVEAVLAGRAAGSGFSVGDAKAATGLSRKWVLPFLNRMERDGLVRREGDVRIVLLALEF